MAWWGTLLGGTLGYMLGGPLGALLGAALGRNFDRGITITDRHDSYGPGRQERVQAAFFSASFSVMGHIAKADGQVSADEISAAEAIMAHMQLGANQRKAAIRLFNAGKQADFRLDEILDQFRRECHGRHNLARIFIEIQITTAQADGKLHAAERRILHHIGDRLGFSSAEIDQLLAAAGARTGATGTRQSLDDAYKVLGVDRQASDAEVKKAYRRLMNQHHPDKLIAKGLPEEMIELANEKTGLIKAAYEQIKESRKT